MAIEEIRVRSWAHLNEVLFDEPIHPLIGRYRSNFAFRGVSDASYGLETTLMRLGGDYASLEPHILRSFQKYAHREMHEEAYIWNWLALAQHHGLPTRLLDWTYSPYVALNFCTNHTERYAADGAIWCVNFVATNRHLPTGLMGCLRDASARVFTTRMLHEEVNTLDAFDHQRDNPFVVFLEPPSLDARIVNQSGLFSVMSDPRLPMDQWFSPAEDVCRKIIIPAEIKWEIRDKLDQSNINERVLFPGLDGLCTYLTRYYTPSR